MTAIRSQTKELLHEKDETIQVRKARATSDVVALFPTGKTPLSTAPEHRGSPGPVYHTAFMQCRACCNCDPLCSYFGKGRFDALGHYLG